MITYAELQAIPSDPREPSGIERDCLDTARRGKLLESRGMMIPAEEWATRLAHCAERLEAYDRSTESRGLDKGPAKETAIKTGQVVDMAGFRANRDSLRAEETR